MQENLRPGVYSRYHMTGGFGKGRDAALILPGAGDLTHYKMLSAEQEGAMDGKTALCLGLLLEAGACGVWLLPVAGPLRDALPLLEGKNLGAVVCGLTGQEDLLALGDFTQREEERCRETVAFVGINAPEEAVTAAEGLDSKRVCLCCPGVTAQGAEEPDALYAACSLAGAVLGMNSPSRSLTGMEFPVLTSVQPLEESVIQRLLGAGVCVFEPFGEGVSLIRAVTTKTSAPAGKSLQTVLTGDYVIRGLRRELEGLLKEVGTVSRNSIRDRVAVYLAEKTEEGALTGFDPPRVAGDKTDPDTCLVEVSFGAAHLPERIRLTAHVRA